VAALYVFRWIKLFRAAKALNQNRDLDFHRRIVCGVAPKGKRRFTVRSREI
jgi:hypothetical protein